MHDTPDIVPVGGEALVPPHRDQLGLPHFEILLGEVVLLASPDVLPEDPDVLVPVQPGLFVPEAQSVEELVQHHAVLDTPGTQRHQLDTHLGTEI